MSLKEISNMFGWGSIAGRAVSGWFHYRLLVYVTTKRKGRPYGTHTIREWLNASSHPVQTKWRVKCSVVLATKVAANKGNVKWLWFGEIFENPCKCKVTKYLIQNTQNTQIEEPAVNVMIIGASRANYTIKLNSILIYPYQHFFMQPWCI